MRTVYYVEDSVSMQEIVKHCLAQEFKVSTFNNCAEALAFIQTGAIPDIILTDLDTPVLNGFAFLTQLRSSDFFKAVPVIVLSGEDSSDSRIKCLEAGADDYIVKPFNPLELQARINNVLKRVKR